MAASRLLLLLSAFSPISSHRTYVELIPNGPTFAKLGWPAVGHLAPTPVAASAAAHQMAVEDVVHCNRSTSQKDAVCSLRNLHWSGTIFLRNRFGHDFASAAFTWTTALCRRDSDGDGLSNGEELGDPHCIWIKGSSASVIDPALLSHPGIPGPDGRLEAIAQLPRSAFHQPELRIVKRAPAAELFYYHYCVIPLILSVGLLLYLSCAEAPYPRWWLVLLEAYLISHVGVFLGNHRWASHHAFRPVAALKWVFTALAAFGAGGGPVHWSYLHRLHHRTCDRPLDLQSPAPPRTFLDGRIFWFTTPNEHFAMGSWVNAEALVADLLHDEEIPNFGKSPEAYIRMHVAILLTLTLSSLLYHAATTHCHGAPAHVATTRTSSIGIGPKAWALPTCRILRIILTKTAVSVAWYFFLPVAIAFQVVMLVIDAVHLWGEHTFEDAMSPACGARNNAFLLMPLLGENWHNNHHGSPNSASTSVFWYAEATAAAEASAEPGAAAEAKAEARAEARAEGYARCPVHHVASTPCPLNLHVSTMLAAHYAPCTCM